jgi:hypothetical protein
MWVDHEAEVTARMRDRLRDADRRRLAAHAAPAARAKGGRTGAARPAGGFGWRLRQAAGYGLVRTGLRLLETGRA